MAAARVAHRLGAVTHRVVGIGLGSFGGSALTDPAITVPIAPSEGIPVTYVPARNTVFLAMGLGFAEVLNASAVYTGVNAVDYSGYPDCRPEFLAAFQRLANVATRQAVEGAPVRIVAPLLELSKRDIVLLARQLDCDLAETVSCYQPDDAGRACGACDACRLRRAGFAAAGVTDPTRYR
jgi:7-cyano-7-deazaguanine synthase